MPRQSIPAPADTQVSYRGLDFLGYPHYRVGDDGSVWTCRRGRSRPPSPWRPMRPQTAGNEYPRVKLWNANGRKRFHVHVLVLTAFVGPCPAGMACRHLDGNPQNNALPNLRWGTYLENTDDMRRHGRLVRGERHGRAKLTEEQVRLLRRLHAARTCSIESLAAQFGISPWTVHAVVARRHWSHVTD
jgi:hypothetical protein